MELLLGLLFWIIGVVLGVIIATRRKGEHESDGILVINKQDPDFATCGIKFSKDVETISKQSTVSLAIIVKNSRK